MIDRRRLILSLLGTPLFFALFMFLPAGTWHWTRGWLFTLVYLGSMTVSAVVIWRKNPELFAARINRHAGTKPWDKTLLKGFFVAMLAMFVVAALDDGRFHWFPLPWSVVATGYALLLAGLALITWAQSANKFFEPTVRLQTDRDQRVIDSGPYAFVRHPGYVSWLPMAVGIALSLGSLWALIPALLSCLLFVLRTKWEDQTLQAELPGYQEYAQRVQHKWIPGVW
jgi:protein-S-isoprenylcysteine O-methyltransferase Ste14